MKSFQLEAFSLSQPVSVTQSVVPSRCLYSAQVNSTARNPAPTTTAYTSLVRLNGTAALLTYDMLSSPRVMWSMELALAVGPQRGNENA